MFKLKSATHRRSQNMFCSRNHFVLLIFSLLCTIIVLTQQAVALTIPPSQPASDSSPTSSLASSSESLAMILPQVKASKGKMLSVLEQETSFNNNNDNDAMMAADVLTPGQQVINAVPDKERGDFIMYELVIALKETEEDVDDKERWLRNLEDVEEFYSKNLTTLENVPIYENFSQDLLQWIEEQFNLTHQNVYNQLRSRSQLLCTSDGVCYNSKNIGNYCCPF